MDPADKTACGAEQVVPRARSRAPSTRGGHIHVSWFNGAFADFVARGRKQHGKGSRAMAETNVTILVLQTIEGVAIDLTPHARFLDRLEPPRYVAHRRARLRL